MPPLLLHSGLSDDQLAVTMSEDEHNRYLSLVFDGSRLDFFATRDKLLAIYNKSEDFYLYQVCQKGDQGAVVSRVKPNDPPRTKPIAKKETGKLTDEADDDQIARVINAFLDCSAVAPALKRLKVAKAGFLARLENQIPTPAGLLRFEDDLGQRFVIDFSSNKAMINGKTYNNSYWLPVRFNKTSGCFEYRSGWDSTELCDHEFQARWQAFPFLCGGDYNPLLHRHFNAYRHQSAPNGDAAKQSRSLYLAPKFID